MELHGILERIIKALSDSGLDYVIFGGIAVILKG